jgi:hypothetical protein
MGKTIFIFYAAVVIIGVAAFSYSNRSDTGSSAYRSGSTYGGGGYSGGSGGSGRHK